MVRGGIRILGQTRRPELQRAHRIGTVGEVQKAVAEVRSQIAEVKPKRLRLFRILRGSVDHSGVIGGRHFSEVPCLLQCIATGIAIDERPRLLCVLASA